VKRISYKFSVLIGRDPDYMLHVNPNLEEKGLTMVYNPTEGMITKSISLPLYCTGLTDMALIREGEGKPKKCKLDREYNVQMEMEVHARGYNWYVIERNRYKGDFFYEA
jgi:hypothetical protein